MDQKKFRRLTKLTKIDRKIRRSIIAGDYKEAIAAELEHRKELSFLIQGCGPMEDD